MCCGISILAMSLAAVLAEQSKSAELFATAMTATGQDYLAARESFLRIPVEESRPYLEQKRQSTDWQESAIAEVTLDRLQHPGRMDAAWNKAVKAGEYRRLSASGTLKPAGAGTSASILIRELGTLTFPFAVEMITKGVPQCTEEWQKQIPFIILYSVGRHRTRDGGLSPIKEPKAAHLLLWCLEREWSEPVQRLIGNACYSLGTYELVETVKRKADQAITAEAKTRYEEASKNLIAGVRRVEGAEARATQPATRPAIPPFLEFDPKTQKFVTKPGYTPPNTQPVSSSQPARNP